MVISIQRNDIHTMKLRNRHVSLVLMKMLRSKMPNLVYVTLGRPEDCLMRGKYTLQLHDLVYIPNYDLIEKINNTYNDFNVIIARLYPIFILSTIQINEKPV